MDGGGGGGGGRPRDHLTAQGALLEEKRLSQTARLYVCVLCCVVLFSVMLCSCCLLRALPTCRYLCALAFPPPQPPPLRGGE